MIPRPLALLIDAGPLFYRAYFAIRSLIGRDGSQVNAVYGFTRSLLELLQEWRPEFAVAAFDDPATPTFRHRLYPEYKRTRPAASERLTAQYARAMEAARVMGLAVVQVPGFEADDLLATLTRRLRARDVACVIVGKDKDLAQLVRPGVWFSPGSRDEVMDAAAVRARYGVPPVRLPDLLALQGDRGDNIPGVAGIGERNARRLLAAGVPLWGPGAGSAVLAAASIPDAAATAEALRRGQASFELSRTLATLREDVPLALSDEAMRYTGIDTEAVRAFCDRLGFDRLRDQILAFAEEVRAAEGMNE